MYNQNYDYISHHGILGQKWGVRRYQNKDGSLTNAGKKRLSKQLRKEFDNKNQSFEQRGNNIVKLTNARSNVKLNTAVVKYRQTETQAKTLLNDYNNSGSKYQGMAGIANALITNHKAKMRDISTNAWFFAEEDGDQSFNTSASLYLHDTKKAGLANNILNKSNKYKDDIMNEGHKYIGDLLGKYSNTKMNDVLGRDLKSKTVDAIFVDAAKNDYNTFTLREAKNNSWNSNKEAVNASKKILSKIDKSIYEKGTNKSWFVFDDAVNKLGYADKSYDELTQNDWNRINKYIREN